MDNNALREVMSKRRSNLTSIFRDNASKEINEKLIETSYFKYAETIAAYLAIASEVNLNKSIESAFHDNKKVYLPCVDIPKKGDMVFSPWENNADLKKVSFGLTEPSPEQATNAQQGINLVIVPLLAFNAKGYRLGWGKGYYDKHFAFRKNNTLPPILIGVAFSCQQTELINTMDWDIPLDKIITEKEIINISG